MDAIARRTAALYDLAVADWPGEIESDRALAARSAGGLLEVGCGTGRVTLHLEGLASPLVGLDLSAAMLEVARVKSQSIHWVEGDMRSYDLGATSGLILIPGHSFQHMQTADDQLSCLECTLRHLPPGGTLVAHPHHQDLHGLAGLPFAAASKVEPGPDMLDPKSGHCFAVRRRGPSNPPAQRRRSSASNRSLTSVLSFLASGGRSRCGCTVSSGWRWDTPCAEPDSKRSRSSRISSAVRCRTGAG